MVLPKVISLIPSATEIVAFLGLGDRLVGRSHECDYPEFVQSLPICTQPKFNPEGTSSEIHDRVTSLLQSALSVYRVETELLAQLQPTHIVTQAQCEVCAVSLAEVEQAVVSLTNSTPKIISLQPNTLNDLWSDLAHVAAMLGVDASEKLAALQSRVAACAQLTQDIAAVDRPTVVCIEWTDPLMAAGNWIPELVELAGGKLPTHPSDPSGKSAFGAIGQHSPWLTWEALLEANPDYIIAMPCGYDLDRTRQDAQHLTQHPQWQTLKAVKEGQVFITDGNQYFNRPGPRLVDSLEILTEILHPDRLPIRYKGKGWDVLH